MDPDYCKDVNGTSETTETNLEQKNQDTNI